MPSSAYVACSHMFPGNLRMVRICMGCLLPPTHAPWDLQWSHVSRTGIQWPSATVSSYPMNQTVFWTYVIISVLGELWSQLHTFLPSNVDWPHCLQLSPCRFILCLLFYFLQILLIELGTWGHLPHPTRADTFLSSYGDSPGMTAIPTRFSRIPLLCWKPQDGMTRHSPLLEFGMRPLSPLRMWPVDQGPSSNRAQEARLILHS